MISENVNNKLSYGVSARLYETEMLMLADIMEASRFDTADDVFHEMSKSKSKCIRNIIRIYHQDLCQLGILERR